MKRREFIALPLISMALPSGKTTDFYKMVSVVITLKPGDFQNHLEDIEELMMEEVTTQNILDKIRLDGYDPHGAIKFKVAV